jgi:hypothetical protein
MMKGGFHRTIRRHIPEAETLYICYIFKILTQYGIPWTTVNICCGI